MKEEKREEEEKILLLKKLWLAIVCEEVPASL